MKQGGFMTLKQASEATGIPMVTLRKAARKGVLKAEKFGPQLWVVLQADLYEWLNNPAAHKKGRPPKK